MEEENIEQILIKTFKIHPFWIEFFKDQNMMHSIVLSQLDTLVPQIEEYVILFSSNYKFLSSFYQGDITKFKVLLGDIVLFMDISKKFKENAPQWEEMSFPSMKPTGYKLFDLVVQHIKEDKKTYPKEMKELCLLIFLYGGKATYNLLSDLIPLPSLSLIRRELGMIENIQEGHLRGQELKDFLVKNKLPLHVWLSEDATRSITQIEYDTKEDKFIGFVLPEHESTGMPVTNKYQNISPNVLKLALLNDPKSNYLYTIMCQPLRKGAPTFCLCTFGTNNCFKGDTVMKRINYIVESLHKLGISVIGWSADGGSRLLSSMKKLADLKYSNDELHIPPEFRAFFFSKINASISPIQDWLHIITKLRNILIQISNCLRIGKHTISFSFLQNLVKFRPRGEHNLNQSDIDCNDRMNVKSAEKLFQPNVLSLLEQYYGQETKGLVLYLTMMRNISDAFSPIEPLESRISKIWYNVFVLRAWRYECKRERSLKNFVTSNVYNCIELNAHMLINVYIHLRDLNKLELFLPELFNSQACENFFRCARSLTSTQSTVINFTTLQFLHKIKRIETIIELSSKFKETKSINNLINVPALSNDSICQIVLAAQKKADETLQELGIQPSYDHWHIGLEIEKSMTKKEEINDNKDDETDDTNELDELFQSDNEDDLIEDSSGYLEAPRSVTNNQYFTLKHSNGESFNIRKGYLCKIYQIKDNVSTDRLHRFRSITSITAPRSNNNMPTICVDDWILFETIPHICHVIYFKNMNKKTKKETANKNKSLELNDENKNQVGVMCNFFNCDLISPNHLTLRLSESLPFVIPLSHFSCMLTKPFTSDNDSMFYEDECVIEQIMSHLSSI